jgi:hypothetical protein
MRRLWHAILCLLGHHAFVVRRVFSPHSRQVGCANCQRLWGMNDDVRAFVAWDGSFEQLYRDVGQWPGGVP